MTQVNRPHAAAGELAPGLYLVATPIGNARDVTLRALDVLATAQVLACEDTRRTLKLLALHGIAAGKRLTSYHDANAPRARPRLIGRLRAGASVALVSDAGSPLISDPGYRLVREAIAEGIAVTVVPGASSVIGALSLSGLPTDRFLFAGFLPPRSAARRRALAELREVRASLVVMEAPGRVATTLADIADVLGARQVAVARELTKLHEEVRRGPADQLAAAYAEAPPRGEVTLVIAPPDAPAEPSAEEIDALLRTALASHKTRAAAQEVAAATGVSRQRLYARALELKDEQA